MDNGTMIETFKYFNYNQLAKSSLVSKRFRNLICTNRHRLALLYVQEISMKNTATYLSGIEMFDQNLSPEEYNEWVIRKQYSEQIPLEGQGIAAEKSRQYGDKVYVLNARAAYKDPYDRQYYSGQIYSSCIVLNARAKLNNTNWPLFQHCVHLLADPFIYIQYMELTFQRETLSLLDGAIQDRRLQCNKLSVNFDGDYQKSISWIKDHVLCNKIQINVYKDINEIGEYIYSNYNEELFDFIVCGANCTSDIQVTNYDLSKVIADLVQKFVDLKGCDEFQMVASIHGRVSCRSAEELKRDYIKFFAKEKRREANDNTEQVFEIVNYAIGKKLLLTITSCTHNLFSLFIFKIQNL